MDKLLDKKAEFQFDIAFQDQQYRVVVTYYKPARGHRQWSTYIFDGGTPRWRVNFGMVSQALILDRMEVIWDHDSDPTAPDLAIDSRDMFLDAVQAGLDQLPH